MSREQGDGGESREELQRRMDEARDSISETVAEIKTVVTHQYEEVRDRVETVREGVSEVLDWREQFERNPVVWGAGAVSVGILIGIGLSRAFDDDDDEPPARGRRRRESREPSAGQRLMGELTGLADAVLPTVSGHIKEMFGLDLDAYLRETRRKRLAEKPAPPRATKKSPPRKAAAKKRAAKKGGARKPRPKTS